MFKGTTTILFLKIIGEVLGLLTVVAVARKYSLDTSGLFLYLLNNLFLFGTIATLGLGPTFHRFIPIYRNTERLDEIRALIRAALGWATISLGVAAVVFSAFQMSIDGAALTLTQQAIFATCIVFCAAMLLSRQLLRSFGYAFWSDFSYQLLRPLVCLLIILCGTWVVASEWVILASLLLPLILAFGYDTLRLGRELNFRLSGPRSNDKKNWRKLSLYYVATALSRILLDRLDLLVVGAFVGLEAAAVYGVAARVAMLPAVLVDPVQAMFRPRSSRNFYNGNLEALRVDIVQGALWITTTSLLIGTILCVAPTFWLQIFGKAFDPWVSTLLMVLLLTGRIFSANASVSQSLLLMTGHERQQALINLICIILYPIALVVATLEFEVVGAASVTLVARFLLAYVSISVAPRLTGFWGILPPTWANLKTAFQPFLDVCPKTTIRWWPRQE